MTCENINFKYILTHCKGKKCLRRVLFVPIGICFKESACLGAFHALPATLQKARSLFKSGYSRHEDGTAVRGKRAKAEMTGSHFLDMSNLEVSAYIAERNVGNFEQKVFCTGRMIL